MVTTDILVGSLGTIALIIAWLWETWENVEKRKITIHLHFAILYIIGNVLLLLYSWWINSIVFVVLEIFLLAAILAETIYAIKLRGKKWKK